MAGGLGLELGGDAVYQGELEHRPFMGDAERPPKVSDIGLARRVIRLSFALSLAGFAICRYLIIEA